MKKTLLTLVIALLILIVILIVLPAPINPASYSPPQAKELSGVMSPNTLLQKSELLAKGQINGPEETAFNSQGVLCSGTQDGDIKCIYPNNEIKILTNTGGRPLGMQFDKKDNLIVCDAYKGLLSINPKGKITVLARSVDGVDFKFTDALDIASDGAIYFTDASSKYKQTEYLYDLLESRPYGRFMRYDPRTKEVTVLIDNLYFANGVALSQNEDFVLINETYRYRVIKYWLKTAKQGTHEIFIDNLPGFPDNINSNGKGTFWLALFTVRNKMIDKSHPSAFIKSIISKLPKMFWPKPKPYGLVISLNEQGKITQSLHDPTGEHLREITSAKEHKGYLYLGSLHNDRIGKYKL
jgi:sugar lactone lactonase YvrE